MIILQKIKNVTKKIIESKKSSKTIQPNFLIDEKNRFDAGKSNSLDKRIEVAFEMPATDAGLLRDDTLVFSSTLKGFKNTDPSLTEKYEIAKNGRRIRVIDGELTKEFDKDICPCCGKKMIINNHLTVSLKHCPFGSEYIKLNINRKQYLCDNCNKTFINDIPFKADGHMITVQLENYINGLLKKGDFNLKEIEFITGVNRNIVKDIDKKRLMEVYTEEDQDGNLKLKKLTSYSTYLGIDEFKLHNGHKYATHIIDLKTGHILWIAKGKKKQVVYDFFEYVGDEWISHVKAVACDMNSDFEEAFKDRYPHIDIVFDHFHIVKYFNEKVVDKIRMDEVKRLKDEGKEEEAKAFKGTKYLLYSTIETLKRKDQEVLDNKVLNKGSELFKTNTVTRKGNYEERYKEIIKDNEILLVVDMIKELLRLAYSCKSKVEMEEHINKIIFLCKESGNKHLLKFKKLLEGHFNGIVSYAEYHISSGKIEGINNKIKTIRRQSYGLPDDEYFFLKLIDISRNRS